MTDEFQDAHQTGNASDSAFEALAVINAERVQLASERDELREQLENHKIAYASACEAIARHRPWLFVPGDKVLVLLDETVYSGVVQQIQMPSPLGAQFPDYIVRVLLDEGSAFAGASPWCNPDQVERFGV